MHIGTSNFGSEQKKNEHIKKYQKKKSSGT